MKIHCPNSDCNSHLKTDSIVKDGRFRRSSDSRWVQRYRCKVCGKRFSKASFTLEKYQKKRRINKDVERLLASGVSQRRCALILRVNVKTIALRLPYLAAKARFKHKRRLSKLKHRVEHMQFDDLITKENSKLKPLSISMAVDANTRVILGAKVAQIPAFGHLAKIAREKYGPRECHHRKGLEELFKEVSPTVMPTAKVDSDEHLTYNAFVKKYLPRSDYQRFPSERGCVAGQGELKKVQYDPLFAINHAAAMFRANINRLIRRTWCTTKDPKKLQEHVDVFINFFNSELLRQRGLPAPI